METQDTETMSVVDGDLTYEKADKELNEILEALKGGAITIDRLAEKVDRAAKLATFCNETLRVTEEKVNDIIARLGL